MEECFVQPLCVVVSAEDDRCPRACTQRTFGNAEPDDTIVCAWPRRLEMRSAPDCVADAQPYAAIVGGPDKYACICREAIEK